MPLAIFALVVLEIESHFFPSLAWTVILLFYTSNIAGMTSMCHHAQVWSVEMGVNKLFFAPAGQEPWFSVSHITWNNRWMPLYPSVGWNGVSLHELFAQAGLKT
jgi:hypothetical protein